jgi:hypothetical protein
MLGAAEVFLATWPDNPGGPLSVLAAHARPDADGDRPAHGWVPVYELKPPAA